MSLDPAAVVRLETWHTEQVAAVRVTTADGSCGWGQTSPYQAQITAPMAHKHIAAHVLGRPVTDTAALTSDVLRYECKWIGTFLLRALSGVDTACWDCQGQRAGLPVARLVNADAKRSLATYASSMQRDNAPEEERERFEAFQEAHGTVGHKYKVMAWTGKNVDSVPGRTQGLIRAMGQHFGEEFLIADANGGYFPETAIADSALMADCGVDYLEEPCYYLDLEATAAVARSSQVPVVGGEQDYDALRWQRLLDGIVAIAQPDPCYCGGFTRLLQIAEQAASRGVSVMPHTANRSLVTRFGAHLLAAIPNAGPMLEWSMEEEPWTDDLFTEALTLDNGTLALGDAPGWGAVFHPDWLKKAQYQESRR